MPTALSGSRGLLFEDFEIGTEWESPGRTVTEADIVLFAGLSGDYNQLHTNAEYAKDTIFGRRIAHGLLGLSIVSGLAARLGFVEGTVQAFMGVDWRFKKPIYIGDTLSLRVKLSKKRSVGRLGGGMVVLGMTLVNQRDEVVQKGDWTLLMKGRQDE